MASGLRKPRAVSEAAQEGPVRGLSSRHIQFIALGGAVGAGLFLGSGQGIRTAGPGLLAAYALCGMMIFFIARALGEMALNDPRDGSFTAYAEEYFGPMFGFITGWSYWLSWVLVGIAELTAAGLLMHFWFPLLPQWLTALVALIALYTINRFNVRVFGELEFWFALVKILAIVALMATGIAILAFGMKSDLPTASISNLWSHGGFFPTGLAGFIAVLPIAFFAFGGVELVGLAAREARDPQRALPLAINSVIFRILVFYIGSLTLIMALIPWSSVSAEISPFVVIFERIGLPAAAGVINLVVISAVLSSCNSGLFATARVLRSLSLRGEAPRQVATLDRHGIPLAALNVTALGMLGGVLLNYLIPAKVFGYLLVASAVLLMWNWMMIMATHIRYRQRLDAARGTFRMPGAPVANYLTITFILVVLLLMLRDANLRGPTLLALAWFAALAAGFAGAGVIRRRRPSNR
jgi:amino acid transporter, AAT family